MCPLYVSERHPFFSFEQPPKNSKPTKTNCIRGWGRGRHGVGVLLMGYCLVNWETTLPASISTPALGSLWPHLLAQQSQGSLAKAREHYTWAWREGGWRENRSERTTSFAFLSDYLTPCSQPTDLDQPAGPSSGPPPAHVPAHAPSSSSIQALPLPGNIPSQVQQMKSQKHKNPALAHPA